MNKLETKLLRRIRDSIKSIEPGTDIFLFGSRARGDAKKNSDWDILILSEYENFLKAEDEFRNEVYPIELESGQVITLITYSKKYWDNKLSITPLYKTILSEGIKL